MRKSAAEGAGLAYGIEGSEGRLFLGSTKKDRKIASLFLYKNEKILPGDGPTAGSFAVCLVLGFAPARQMLQLGGEASAAPVRLVLS